VQHDKNRSDDVPSVKRPKEDGIEIKEEKSKIRKDSLCSNGSSAVNGEGGGGEKGGGGGRKRDGDQQEKGGSIV